MNGATLQARVYAGYAAAALRVGLPYVISRPTAALSEATAPTVIGTLNAAFTVHSASGFGFQRPSDYEKPTFHALLDGSQVMVGDFLTSAGNPSFFIASKDALVPILAVQTSRVISIATPGPSAVTAGYTPGTYAGTVGAASAINETAFLSGWPASVLQGARSVSEKLLPGDVGAGMWTVLFPTFAGLSINAGDIMSDDIGRRYTVRTAEFTALGWRLAAQEAQT